MSEADNVYDPLYGSFAGDEGAWSTAKMYFTVPPNGVAKRLLSQAGAAGWRSAKPPYDRMIRMTRRAGVSRTCSSDMYSDMLKLSAFGGLARQKCEYKWHL